MKKIVSVILLVIGFSILSNATYVCYPPYGGGCDAPNGINGAHCFGSNGSCGSQWGGCDCNNPTKCCCCGLKIPALDGEWIMNPLNTNLSFQRVSDQETIYTEYTLDDILEKDEIFQFNIVTIDRILYMQIAIYNKNIIDDQFASGNGVNLAEAFVRSTKYAL